MFERNLNHLFYNHYIIFKKKNVTFKWSINNIWPALVGNILTIQIVFCRRTTNFNNYFLFNQVIFNLMLIFAFLHSHSQLSLINWCLILFVLILLNLFIWILLFFWIVFLFLLVTLELMNHSFIFLDLMILFLD